MMSTSTTEGYFLTKGWTSKHIPKILMFTFFFTRLITQVLGKSLRRQPLKFKQFSRLCEPCKKTKKKFWWSFLFYFWSALNKYLYNRSCFLYWLDTDFHHNCIHDCMCIYLSWVDCLPSCYNFGLNLGRGISLNVLFTTLSCIDS